MGAKLTNAKWKRRLVLLAFDALLAFIAVESSRIFALTDAEMLVVAAFGFGALVVVGIPWVEFGNDGPPPRSG